jgi:DNA-binding MarR family transcriptional regulator
MTSLAPVAARTDTQNAARLRLVVTRLARTLRQHAAAGLTPSQLSALATVEEYGPIRLSDLAQRESVGAPVATRVVASLQELGYVDRVDDATDRRACLIALADPGRRVLAELWSERTAGLNSRIERLTAADAALLDAALPVLEALVRDGDLPTQQA